MLIQRGEKVMVDENLLSPKEKEWLFLAQEKYYLKTHEISTICKTGTFDVVFIASHKMDYVNGHVLILKDENNYYFKQEILYSGWRYSGVSEDGNEESDIQDLINHLRHGNKIRIRIIARSGRTRSVLRYIKNITSGEWSGWKTEEDFQNNGLPIFPFHESGEFPIQILGITNKMEQDKNVIQLKISISKPGRGICRYYILIPEHTAPYNFVKQMDKETLLSGRYYLNCLYDKDCKKLNVLSLAPAKGRRGKNANESLKAARYSYDLKSMTELSKNYETIKISDSKKPLMVQATILDHSKIDYRYSRNRYMLFLLDDGRMIMPAMSISQTKRKDQAELKHLLDGRTNYMEHRKDLFPGQNVKLIFFPSQKSENMILKGIMVLDDARGTLQHKAEYYRDRYVRDGFLPMSQLNRDFTTYTEDELLKYLNSVKSFRRMDKYLFRKKLEQEAQKDPAINLSLYADPFIE